MPPPPRPGAPPTSPPPPALPLQGYNVGASLVEEDKLDLAKQLMEMAKAKVGKGHGEGWGGGGASKHDAPCTWGGL